MTEIVFETLLMARETTRGTPISNPSHLIHLGGNITPEKTIRRAEESRGTLFQHYRHAVTRRGATFECPDVDADTALLPFLLNGAIRAITTPTTPVGATNTRLWTFIRSGLTDNISSYTLWGGDPNVRQWRAAHGMIEEITLSSSAAEEDGTLRIAVNGRCQPTTTQSPVVATPAPIAGPLLPSQFMELWIDTTGAWGTTPVVGRLISAEHTIRTGVTFKHLGGGPTATLGFTRTGRQRVSAITTKIVLEVPDMVQYDQWQSNATVRCRVRHNGPLIEGSLYHYVDVDTFGPFDGFAWGENEGSNRTIELTIEGHVDTATGTDLRVAVQNNRTVL